MEQLGKAVTKISGSLASRPLSERDRPPTVIDEANLPTPYDRQVDVHIPRAVWSGYRIDGKPRTLRRSLTDDERAALVRRADELELILLPYLRPYEDDQVALAILDMLAGFQGTKASGADAMGRVASVMTMLQPYPAWAIKRACAYVRENGYSVEDKEGRRRRERHWPPSDAEIIAEVKETLKLRQDAFDSARALLSAQVDR